MRLQKYMAMCGVASRRRSEELILRGLVRVNGNPVLTPGMTINPDEDIVTVSGKTLKSPKTLYVLFNKPRGVVTTMKDPQQRGTVAEYFQTLPQRVYPVGRLDRDTEGLLLLTNDGELAHRLMHPRYKVEKHYQALVQGGITPQKAAILRKGIILEDGPTAPARVTVQKSGPRESLLLITLREGKKRQIRRMLEKVGNPVIRLRRTGYSFLTLGALKAGHFRHLTQGEVKRLKDQVGLA